VSDACLEKEFLEMVSRLAKGDLYSWRITASQVIPVCFKRASAEMRKTLASTFFELTKDDTPMVRRSAASSLGVFSEALNEPSTELIDAFKAFLNDAQDAVKTEAIKNTVTMSKMLMNHHEVKVEETMLQALNDSIRGTGSWRLRFSVAEILPELADTVQRAITDDHIVPMLEALLSDTEAEVRSEALNSIPAVGKVCSQNLVLEKLVNPIANNIAGDNNVHVRASLAEGICKIGEIVTREECVEHIIPILKKLI